MGQVKITPASEDVKNTYRKAAAELDRVKPYKLVVNTKSGTTSKRFATLDAAKEAFQTLSGTKLLLDFSVKPVRFISYVWQQR